MNDVVIKSCRCDLCDTRDVGVEYHSRGTPVLFVCRTCRPVEVSAAASRAIFDALFESLFAATA